MSKRVLRWLLPAWCFCFAAVLGLPGALWAPDAGKYRLLALGQHNAVPAPFSARILGPAMAGWLGRVTGRGVDTGFLLLGLLCLFALLISTAQLLQSWRAPLIVWAAIFLLPFWADSFHNYYLPDLLHAALLAGLLLLLLYGHSGLALLLLLPAYLARESTLLVALCLVYACWRRIRLQAALAGAMAVISAGLISRHFNQGGGLNVHGVSGGAYIAGKLIWSFSKNVLGLPLWSNTLPECTPLWRRTLPSGYHLGSIQSIGACRPDSWGPARLLLAWFGVFGVGPACALILGRRVVTRRADVSAGRDMVFRFCLLYGLISIVMAPLLGASIDRLVEYGWPFYFVLLPWVLFHSYERMGARSAGLLLLLHLLAAWIAWFSFRQQPSSYLPAALSVVALNGIAYVLMRRLLQFETGNTRE